jgi:hypothetical protein
MAGRLDLRNSFSAGDRLIPEAAQRSASFASLLIIDLTRRKPFGDTATH